MRIERLILPASVGLLLASFTQTQASRGETPADAPSVTHAPLECILPESYPQIEASITSPRVVARTRVYFKAHQHPDWYFVDMKAAEAGPFVGLLPRPLPDTQKIDYYVYALDSGFQTSQTPEYDPPVKAPCRTVGLAAPPAQGLTIGGTRDGQAPIPPGFNKEGITGFLTAAGVLVSTTSSAAPVTAGAAKVGAGKLLLGAGAAAAATGGVIVATSGGGSSSDQSPQPGPTPTPLPTPTPTPTPGPTPTPTPTPETTPTPQPTPTPKPIDVSGSWTGQMASGGCSCLAARLQLDLAQSGAGLGGTARFPESLCTSGGEISEGTVLGASFAFTALASRNSAWWVRFQGSVGSSGAQSNGTFATWEGCQGTWSASR